MKLKKVVALLLSLAVMLTSISLLCVSISAMEVQTQIDIPDEETTYKLDGVTYTVVRTAAQMNELAETNAGGGVNYLLDADLVYSEDVPFKQINLTDGSLNGNGHSITGVHLELGQAAGNNISMFKFTTNNKSVAVSNLTVGAPGEPVSVTATDEAWATNGSCRAGTLFGFLQAKATFENVTVYSNVAAGAYYRTGGFIGEARNNISMKNCVFNGEVTIAAGDETTAVAAGGLIGYGYSGTVAMESCATYGSVSHPNGYAGGLYGGAERHTTYTNCANYATVTGRWSGGLIGDAGKNCWSNIEMNNCFNAGKVTGTDSAAGLINVCVRRADFSTVLINCANIGEVNADNKADLVYSIGTDTSLGELISKLIVTNCGSFGTANQFAITNKAADDASATDTTATAAEALTFMQTNCGYAMFGIEENKIVVKTVPVEAKFLQDKKDAEANKMDIRVIGVLNTTELEKYTNVGFNVTVYDANGDTPVLLKEFDPQTTTTVYTSVRANEGNTVTEYSAVDLGVTYLYMLELRNIPMSGSYIFAITAFATENGQNNTIVSGSGITVAVIDGEIDVAAAEILRVNGSSIYKYEIIYPKDGTLFEEQMAMRLQSYLLDQTGYELTVKNDSEARETEKAFLIGKTKYSTELTDVTLPASQGCVNSTGGDIVAWGNDMTGMVNACKKLTELLINTKSGAFAPIVTINHSIMATGSSNFSTMSFNVKTYDQTDARINRVINVLLRYMPDSIGLQEADETWMRELTEALSDYYEFVGDGREGGSKGDAVPILYSKEKYNLIESGTKWLTSTPDEVSKMDGAQYLRNFTWALLEDKATGVRYLHVNTHLDTAGSAIRSAEVEILMQFLKNYNNVPVVLTGDMNAKLNTNELNLLKDFNLATVFDYKDLTNVKTNANAIDWIYMTPDSVSMTYHTFDDSTYNGDYPSDHSPYYAEFLVNNLGDGEIDHGW